jgi:hypothetical protein
MEIPNLTSKTIIFHFGEYTVTYNGTDIITTKNGEIINTKQSPFIRPTDVDAKYELMEALGVYPVMPVTLS